MKIYKESSEMVKQMEEHFGMVTLIKKLKAVPEADKLIIKGRIILSIMYNTTTTNQQAIDELTTMLENIRRFEYDKS